MSPTWRAYFAGIIDGEGCISIYQQASKKSWVCRVSVGNTDLGMVSALQERSRLGLVYRTETATKRPFYIWQVTKRKDVMIFLYWITPFLIAKKEQAQTMMDHITGLIDVDEADEALREAKKA